MNSSLVAHSFYCLVIFDKLYQLHHDQHPLMSLMLNACLKSSVIWRHVQKLTLKTNMRVQLQHNESVEHFAKQLLDIGNVKM
jgi:hypothetical protein